MEVELLNLFPKIKFDHESDKKRFIEYYENRGYGIYYSAYLVLTTLFPKQNISYEIFSNFIRYDKAIREYLYKYLALYEERLIDYICKSFSYNRNDEINYKNLEKLIKDKCIVASNQNFDINLFNNLNLTLGNMFYLIKRLNPTFISKNISDEILDLRNMVMHHNLLLVNVKEPINKSNIASRNNYINKLIEIFLDQLPTNYKTSFNDVINKINNKTKSPIKLVLGGINYGL